MANAAPRRSRSVPELLPDHLCTPSTRAYRCARVHFQPLPGRSCGLIAAQVPTDTVKPGVSLTLRAFSLVSRHASLELGTYGAGTIIDERNW